jgi:Uma2 family endonuclease
MQGTAVSPCREAIDHLPPGAMLVVHGVTWDEYAHLLEELSDRPGVRVTFDKGRLQAVSPLRAHEHYIQVLNDLTTLTADVLDLPLEKIGATTLRQPEHERGVEADCCFYLASADRIEGKITLDLAVDPPPDIAVEIDMSSDSDAKLPIYAGLGVPEIWRYDGKRAGIFQLREDSTGYTPVERSRFLPCVTPEVLDRFLVMSKTTGQSEVRRAIRKWLAQQ